MAQARNSEDRVLDKDERELVEATRHPHLGTLGPSELADLTRRLRERRDRARGLADKQRRNARGKGERATGGDAHSDGGNRQKAAALSAALARLNKARARFDEGADETTDA